MNLGSVPLAVLLLSPIASGGQAVTRPVLSATPAPAAPVQAPAGNAPATNPQNPPAGVSGASQVANPNVPPPPEASSSTYIINSGDTIQVNVWKEPTLSGSFPVRPDGMISLALIGDLPAADFTPMRLSMDIAARLKKYVNDPNVTVTVLAVRPKQVYLIGEVAHIGPVVITPEMTPLQVISAAGGLSPYAKTKRIYILRGEAGKQKKIPYDYKKALKTGDEQGVTLIPGDTIVVP